MTKAMSTEIKWSTSRATLRRPQLHLGRVCRRRRRRLSRHQLELRREPNRPPRPPPPPSCNRSKEQPRLPLESPPRRRPRPRPPHRLAHGHRSSRHLDPIDSTRSRRPPSVASACIVTSECTSVYERSVPCFPSPGTTLSAARANVRPARGISETIHDRTIGCHDAPAASISSTVGGGGYRARLCQ